ncbi:MAG: DNA primase [Candidatus Margulisiibacteriota bacterium]|nr:DNA primase [Candidatus Margulisiibacteriota bacterium]
MIPAHIIEEIRNKSDIVKVISEFVQLKKRGKNYLGLCPFHAEKDASFTVSPEKQIFHCFGCNEGGNAFAFLMKIENISFVEAVEELGIKVGIDVPKPKTAGRSRGEKDKLYQVMKLAADYFQSNLNDEALAYLKKRKITDKTKEAFRLGFALPGWDNLFKHLVSRGVDPQLIEKSGLILAREGKSGYYDRFRNRLIFTICDQRGRVLAFGGRSLGDEEPKYMNSSDTLIYHKGETLFGLDLSKDSIKKSKTAVMVEGYFDLITPFQAGITNIVATLGTALTVNQCKLLSRYCDTVILGFDADAAGGIAAERSIELLRGQGLKVKVAKLSGGKDPDEIINKLGREGFDQCLNSSLPYLEFKINRTLLRHNLKEIEGRGKALQEVSALLNTEKDPFVQKEYAKLIAPVLKTSTDTILSETKRSKQYKRMGRGLLHRKTEKPASKVHEAEKTIIAIAAQNAGSLKTLRDHLKVDDFSIPDIKKIAELMFSAEAENNNPAHFILDNLPEEGTRKFLSGILMSDRLVHSSDDKQIMEDCINVIKGVRQKNKIEILKTEIREAEKKGETQKVSQLLSALKSEIAQSNVR